MKAAVEGVGSTLQTAPSLSVHAAHGKRKADRGRRHGPDVKFEGFCLRTAGVD